MLLFGSVTIHASTQIAIMAQATSGSDPEEGSDAHSECGENKQEQERQESQWQWRGCMRPSKWQELMTQ